ncbi:unnamed protein product [Didymodactylos carnosus]|uniref:DUF4371 domain-containing protein n=1 Tax=Didymodactylos carnosus TaxID=1234261 RepID=A0A814ZK98_9BILA|nr:unnamed protein product [Didymodactylos carnosus]CAF4008753.1 unnamed protein product [Didymodactylos carnosus]
MASSVQRQQEQRRRMLLMEITSIIYLLRQGLALRGHVDEESNLIQLLKLRSIDDSDLQDWINDKKYLSHDIVNEITKEISLTIVRDIVKQISKRKWFALICDEISDESTTEQLCESLFELRMICTKFSKTSSHYIN